MARLVIFGAGDIARLVRYYFTHDSEHEVVAFTVDQQYLNGESFLELPLVAFEDIETLYPPQDYKMFVALSYAKMNKVQAAKYYQTKQAGYELVSYISNRCSFLTEYGAGENCFILEDNTIQPFVRIGNNVTLWCGNHIGRDD
jgi:FlaA1/EpsC-like NDP-sugar epimerase